MEATTQYLPKKRTILPYYVIAAFSFLIVNLLTFFSVSKFSAHFFQPALLAITHLTVLGWATMIIIGASNQLIPVITDCKLYSNKLPVICLILLVPGVSMVVYSFWKFHLSFMMYGGVFLVLSALILHSINMFISSATAPKANVALDFILTAHVWLIITAVLGIVLLLNLRFGFLPSDNLYYLQVHASLGMVGWFLLLVIGVSSRLLPMFLLSRKEKKVYLNIAWYFINSGLVLFFVDGLILNSRVGKIFYAALILAGVLFYLAYVKTCFASGLRKKIDAGMKQSLLAIGLIALPFILFIIANLYLKNAPSSLIIGYGYSFFAGFISTLIMGQTFKTLPFIVWMHITKAGLNTTVQPKDLYKERLVLLQMFLYVTGFLSFLSGILLPLTSLRYAGSTLMAFAAFVYFGHVVHILKQLRKA